MDTENNNKNSQKKKKKKKKKKKDEEEQQKQQQKSGPSPYFLGEIHLHMFVTGRSWIYFDHVTDFKILWLPIKNLQTLQPKIVCLLS